MRNIILIAALALASIAQAQEIIWEEDTNPWFDRSKEIEGIVSLDFITPEDVYDVIVFRVAESGKKIPHAARYTTEGKRTNHILFFCEGDFYAIGVTAESEIETEMYFSVTEDMRVSDADKEYTYVMELR